jgi:hypothetical protein
MNQMNDEVGYLLTTVLSGAVVFAYRLLSQVIDRGVEIKIPPRRR